MVFLSFRFQDGAKARLVRDALDSRGLAVWHAPEKLRDAGGEDFMKSIAAAIRSADAVVVLVGHGWELDSEGNSLLESELDYVRREVTLALELDLRVIPVCMDGAPLPSVERLPPLMRRLLALQAMPLHTEEGAHWTIELDAIARRCRSSRLTRLRRSLRIIPPPWVAWTLLAAVAAVQGWRIAHASLSLIGKVSDAQAEILTQLRDAPSGEPRALDVLGMSLWTAFPTLQGWLAEDATNWKVTIRMLDPTFARANPNISDYNDPSDGIRAWWASTCAGLAARAIEVELYTYAWLPTIHGYRIRSGAGVRRYVSSTRWNPGTKALVLANRYQYAVVSERLPLDPVGGAVAGWFDDWLDDAPYTKVDLGDCAGASPQPR